MDEQWLEIPGETGSAQEMMDRIRGRIAGRHDEALLEDGEAPQSVARGLWQEMIGDPPDRASGQQLRPRDCDIVPRDYSVDWRVPILGPIHAVLRRVIDAEIQRYLMSSLEKQSWFNGQVQRRLDDLTQENLRLRQEIEALRRAQEERR
jgi:hypothetical protein